MVKLTSTILRFTCLLAVACLSGRPGSISAGAAEPESPSQSQGYTGSVSCRECHEKFYKLWAPSHHGLAMQSYMAEFAQKELTPQAEDLLIGKYSYHADISNG